MNGPRTEAGLTHLGNSNRFHAPIQACRTVLNQLVETDPTRYKWLYNFSLENPPHREQEYVRGLLQADRELGERILVTRLNMFQAREPAGTGSRSP